MKLPFEEPKLGLSIKPVDLSLRSWIDDPSLSEQTRTRLLRANMLLVPDEGHAGSGVRYFPQGTIDFFDFLTKNKPQDLVIDACVEDDDYKELSLHSDILIIAGLVVSHVVVPLAVNLVSDYISDWLKNRKNDSAVKAKLTVTFEQNRRSIEIEYYGAAEEYSKAIHDALSKIESLPEDDLATLANYSQLNADLAAHGAADDSSGLSNT